MSLGLDLELRLEEREPHRVFVSVLLAPRDGAEARVDGVALQLQAPDGEAVGPRMLLPIAGAVRSLILSTIELRTLGDELPQGSRVVGTAWREAEQVEVTIPTDPGTAFEAHVRGHQRAASRDVRRYLEPLLADERAVFSALYPWIDEPMVPPEPAGELEVVDHEPDSDEIVDDLAEEIGLDAESAEWLKDLLDEPD